MKNSNYIDELIERHHDILEELYQIATDEKSEAAILKKLSYMSDSYILVGLSLNPSTPPEVLQRFIDLYPGVGGTDEEMRIHVVSNVSLPKETLRHLFLNDKSDAVREAADRALANRE